MNQTKSKMELNSINQNERISWFPGHMHKSYRGLEKIRKDLNLIIEVKDARAQKASDNHELSVFFRDKPILKVYLKKDLAPKSSDDSLCLNSFDHTTRKKIIVQINNILADWLANKRKKGLINPIVQVLICGLPNLGKSTLINQLVQKKIAKVADSPGVTKAFQRHKFYENMWVYDTPGIFYKKIDDKIIGYQLALIGCIKREAIPLKATLEYAYQYLKEHYLNLLEASLNQKLLPTDQFDDFIIKLAQKMHFLVKEKNYDLERTMWYFYDQIRTGKIGLISWDLQ